MSYSRWVDSRWYVYWSAPGSGKIKEDQVVIIIDVEGGSFSYSYGVLKGEIDYYIKEEIIPEMENVNKEEVEDLKECLSRFIKDVDNYFKENKKNEDLGI